MDINGTSSSCEPHEATLNWTNGRRWMGGWLLKNGSTKTPTYMLLLPGWTPL